MHKQNLCVCVCGYKRMHSDCLSVRLIFIRGSLIEYMGILYACTWFLDFEHLLFISFNDLFNALLLLLTIYFP